MPSAKRAAKALGGAAPKPKPKAKASTPKQKPAAETPKAEAQPVQEQAPVQAPAKTFKDSVAEAKEYWKRLEAMGLVEEGVDANKAQQALLRDILERNKVEMPDWVRQRGEAPSGPSQADLMAGASPAPKPAPKPAPGMPDPYEAMGTFGVDNGKPAPTPEASVPEATDPSGKGRMAGMADKYDRIFGRGKMNAAKTLGYGGLAGIAAPWVGGGIINAARAKSIDMNRPDQYSAGEPAQEQARAPMTEEQMAAARAKVLERLRGQQ